MAILFAFHVVLLANPRVKLNKNKIKSAKDITAGQVIAVHTVSANHIQGGSITGPTILDSMETLRRLIYLKKSELYLL